MPRQLERRINLRIDQPTYKKWIQAWKEWQRDSGVHVPLSEFLRLLINKGL